METKKCSKCKQTKSVSDFYIKCRNPLRYHTVCKKCCVKIKEDYRKKCQYCGKEYKPYTTIDKYCSAKCRIGNEKSKRSSNWTEEQCNKIKGKNNPAYRNGIYCRDIKKSDIGQKLYLKVRNALIKKMKKDYGYVFCEHCKTSNSLKFEMHHIYFRSEKPNHKHLHDKRNLIYLCIQCHNDFHKDKPMRNYLIKDRKLKQLFES